MVVSPKRGMRINSPFTPAQMKWIILQYGKVENITKVRRAFRLHFKLCPFHVPKSYAFYRLVKRFEDTDGQTSITQEDINAVRDLLEAQGGQTTSVRDLAYALTMSTGKVWKVLRKELKLFPYKPKTVQPLTERHKEDRVKACKFFTKQDDELFEKVIWSDEKWFVLKTKPNKQN